MKDHMPYAHHMPIICHLDPFFGPYHMPQTSLNCSWVPGSLGPWVDLQRSQGKDAAEIISSVEFLAALDFLASLLFHLRGSL